MSRQDTFDRLVDAIHEAALDETYWPAASALIDKACGATGNGLVFGEGPDDDVKVRFARYYSRGQRRQDVVSTYFNLYHAIDERVPRLRQLPDGTVAHVSDLYSDTERKSSPVYNEGLPRFGTQNGLNVRLDGPTGGRIVFALADPVASQGWQADDVAVLRALLPHLRQFVRVRHALAPAEAVGSSLTDLLSHTGIGVVRLDRQGRIATLNGPARELLCRTHALRDHKGVLRAWLPTDDARLQRLVAAALPTAGETVAGGSMRICRPDSPAGYVLHVHPITSARLDGNAPNFGALVLVVDLANRRVVAPPRVVATILDLTPREAEVAVLAAKGKTLHEIALLLNRRESSVRTHMKRMHRKLGISRRSQLVDLVLQASAFSLPADQP